MKSFVHDVALHFADDAGNLSVAEIRGKRTVILELRCSEKDVGRVIGKNGKTIGAMRTLVGAVAARSKRKAILEVIG